MACAGIVSRHASLEGRKLGSQMSSTAQQIRQWQGPEILSLAFRLFFLLGAVWAVLSMVIWIAMLTGTLQLASSFDPVSWHAHEFLFGYLPIVLAGFLFTAVPNWTGRLPVVGWPLLWLAGLWLAGRAAVAYSALLPLVIVITADLSFLAVTLLVTGREIVAGKNWRNLPVLVMLLVLFFANGWFHLENWQGNYAAGGYGLRLGLAAAVMMIALIGGRIVPSFTRNWLAKRGSPRLPVPFNRFDRASLAVLVLALFAWIAAPDAVWTGLALMIAGALQLWRLARWRGDRTGAEPLVWVLHAGYLFVPLGAIALGASITFPASLAAANAQHVWMAGAIPVMTLAVMTRATLGHTGRELHAGAMTTMIYAAIIAACFLRVGNTLWPWADGLGHVLAAVAWLLAFAGFIVVYGPMLSGQRRQEPG
jgi:uncharacterized protein involved in response to NO